MAYFSQKRFVDIGQHLYTNWMETLKVHEGAPEDKIRETMSQAANLAFMAAEEFAKVFEGQEDRPKENNSN